MITNVGTDDKVHNEENNISHSNAEIIETVNPSN